MWLLLTGYEAHPGEGFSRLIHCAEALHLILLVDLGAVKFNADCLEHAEGRRCHGC